VKDEHGERGRPREDVDRPGSPSATETAGSDSAAAIDATEA
jgi:hypothetical protein